MARLTWRTSADRRGHRAVNQSTTNNAPKPNFACDTATNRLLPGSGQSGAMVYDTAFKNNALKMIDNEPSVRSVAQRLGSGENLWHKWKAARQPQAPALALENAALRALLRRWELEGDLLIKSRKVTTSVR